MIFLGRLYLVFCWAIVIFILISAPMPEYVSYKTTFYDKGVHVILFGILAYLIVYALGGDKNKRLGLIFLTSFFISILYAGLSEYVQMFIPGRDVSEFDFMAGVSGVILALVYAYGKFSTRKI
jgi:VanZ family protein